MNYENVYKAHFNFSKCKSKILQKVMIKEFLRCRSHMAKAFNANIAKWNKCWDMLNPDWDGHDPKQLKEYNQHISYCANDHVADTFNNSKNRSEILEMYFDDECDIRGRLRLDKDSSIDLELIPVKKE